MYLASIEPCSTVGFDNEPLSSPHTQQLYLVVGRIIFDRSCDHEQSWRAALIHDWPLTFLLAVFSSTSCFAPGFTGVLVWPAGPSWTRRGLSYQPCFPNELQRRSLTLLSPVSCPDYFSPSRREECGLGTRLCRYEQNGGTLLLNTLWQKYLCIV